MCVQIFCMFLQNQELHNQVDCDEIDYLLTMDEPLKKKDKQMEHKSIYTVINLLKHVPENIISKCMSLIQYKQDNNLIFDKIKVNSTIINYKSRRKENVSDITGTAVPSLLELKLKKSISYIDKLEKEFEPQFKRIEHSQYENAPKMRICEIKDRLMQSDMPDPADLLHIANCQNTYVSGYHYKYYQIRDYDWLSKSVLSKLYMRLTSLNISDESDFEVMFCSESTELSGSVDCIDRKNKILYEFKVVDQLQDVHFLQ